MGGGGGGGGSAQRASQHEEVVNLVGWQGLSQDPSYLSFGQVVS